MTTGELNNYILHYLKKDKTQTAIMLTGEWGSGKTYYVEKDLVPFLKKNKATSVVISLYGLDDISMISKSIYMELRMSTLGGKHSETITTGKVIAKNVLKNITGLAGINLGLDDKDLTELYESVNLKDKLLIFEDVERSNISVTSLLGYVNGLVERDSVKVLLVANENEILRKTERKIEYVFSRSSDNKKSDNTEKKVPEEVKLYLRIKEKTISDTIQFNGNFEQAVEQIIKGFDNDRLNILFQSKQELYKEVSNTVRNNCGKNLRTFIFAIQKTIDIIDKMDNNDYENEFYECLMLSNLCFASKIKTDEFPKWEGSNYLSSILGTKDVPLMRFSYDYIRWQSFDRSSVHKVYEAYKEYKFFERNAEYKDSDLRILGNYAEETEESVLTALHNIEQKLNTPDSIGVHAYCKLAYYMIYVGTVVGFDYKKSCKLMIKNVKGLGKKVDMDADIFFSHTYDIQDEKIRQEYETFLNKLTKAITFKDDSQMFSYSPQDLEEFYNKVCRNTSDYIVGHQFLSKYDLNNIVKMLLQSTSGQIHDFRGVLLAVYRYAGKGEFDEADIEAMKQLINLLDEKCENGNQWDKIQLMQIEWLKSNLNQFIEQMT